MIFSCLNLAVPIEIMKHVVHVESKGNPYAIGVVNGRLKRQPRDLSEAVATANMLEQRGYNFSVGIAQVNRYNLKKYGLQSYEHAFQICPNLQAGSRILRECYTRAKDWGRAFSCYYSGNFATGYKHGYVQKVFASMKDGSASKDILVINKVINNLGINNNVNLKVKNKEKIHYQNGQKHTIQYGVRGLIKEGAVFTDITEDGMKLNGNVSTHGSSSDDAFVF